jgi:30S ribosomal protein S31
MGKGDKRTMRGKIFKGSYGKSRPHDPKKKPAAPKAKPTRGGTPSR